MSPSRSGGGVIERSKHRFACIKRLSLATKGKGVDVLVMTATPIPRNPHG